MDNKAPSASKILKRIRKSFSPVQVVVLSFLLIITIGGVLLSLPISHAENESVPVLDAFFTAVSAVCVTGLTTLATATTWSVFGKIVVLFLIQIGGLSLVTILAFFMVFAGKKISLKNRLAIQTTLNEPTLGGMARMVMFVTKGVMAVELLGAMFLFILFLNQGVVWHKALWYGIFHSISAFCNAGFDVIGESSLIPYSDAVGINIVIMTLIITGGIGFIVWDDVFANVKLRLLGRRKRRNNFSLHTKLALTVTGVLLLAGTLFFLTAEYSNPKTIGGLTFSQKLLISSFQSTSLRTAGFATVAQDGMTEASKLICSLLMMIGGSPGGTAGGVKTVTLAIILCSVWSIVKGRTEIVAFERSVSVATLQRALAVAVLMISLLFIGTTILAMTEDAAKFPHTLSDLIFEVSSALGTVGLSTGITPRLSAAGKIVLMACMFIGRIGPITLIASISRGPQIGKELIRYQKEDVMIG